MPCSHAKKLRSQAWKKRFILSFIVFLWVVTFQVLFNSSTSKTKNRAQPVNVLLKSKAATELLQDNKELKPQSTTNVIEVRHNAKQEFKVQALEQNGMTSSNNSKSIVPTAAVDNLARAVSIIDSLQSGNMELHKETKFVFFIPHAVSRRSLNAFSKHDQRAVRRIFDFLEANSDYEAATCTLKSSLKSFSRPDVNDTWCRYSRRQSTMIIRNTGPWLENNSTANCRFQSCSVAKGPFLMRTKVFLKLGWQSHYGKASIYDFILRSRGKMKIARLSCCAFSEELGIIDRGTEEGKHDFPDYSKLAIEHGIVRIVMEDRIEWTKCVADGKYCKEVPFTWPKSLPQAGLPLCCSHALDRMLKDIVKAMDKIGMSYRIVYGTLLGSIRSKAIIPWTHDIDIAINKSLLINPNWNKKLQEILQRRYFVGISFMGAPRAIPLFPAYISVNTTSFFNDTDDLSGDKFFSEDILSTIKNSHTIGNFWRDRGYVDFYEAPEIWWNGSSVITINGKKYTSIRDINYELANWYGKNYLKPILSGSWAGLSDTGAV